MDCLTLILSCLLQNTYVTAGIESQFQAGDHEGRWCYTRWCTGPMGVLKIGTQLNLTRNFDADLGIVHSSYLSVNRNFDNTREQGVESVYLTLTWRPFR